MSGHSVACCTDADRAPRVRRGEHGRGDQRCVEDRSRVGRASHRDPNRRAIAAAPLFAEGSQPQASRRRGRTIPNRGRAERLRRRRAGPHHRVQCAGSAHMVGSSGDYRQCCCRGRVLVVLAPSGTDPEEVRFEVHAPPTTEPTSIALSPDGKMLVFVATTNRQSHLWARPLNAVSARPLAGTENARLPFWSPDSRSVGFAADAQLKRVDIESGAVRVLASGGALGGAWNRDGTILFDRVPGPSLFRVSAEGGEPRAVTQPTPEATDHWSPQFLPDHSHYLIYATGTVPGIYGGVLGAPEPPRRIVDAQAASYVSSGHLLFVRGGRSLRRCSIHTARARGQPCRYRRADRRGQRHRRHCRAVHFCCWPVRVPNGTVYLAAPLCMVRPVRSPVGDHPRIRPR